MSDIQTKLNIESDIKQLSSEKKSLANSVDSLKSESALLSKYISDNKSVLETLEIKINDISNEISKKRLEWNTEKGTQEEELKFKLLEAKKVISRESKFSEIESKIEKKTENIKEREHIIDSKEKEISRLESELKVTSNEVTKRLDTLSLKEKEFESNKETIKVQFIDKINQL